jgi:chemotaxis protein methyltransferase CheR
MTPLDYEFLRKLLKARSGLMLSADKHYLVESRLLPVARRNGLSNLSGLVTKLKMADAEPLTVEVVEAMTTNESLFFRDKTPFDQFRSTIVPALLASRSATRRVRIWCSAASTGQEPYTLAICLKEMGQELAGWRFDIVATDLSTTVLEKAKSGIYSQFEVQRGLPVTMLIKYFSQVGEMWQIAPEIRAMVKFLPLNLLHDFSSLGRFDVVFCRNVLIYFDRRAQPDRQGDRARRVSGIGRRRDGGRPHPGVPPGRRHARALRAEPSRCGDAEEQRRASGSAGAAAGARRALTAAGYGFRTILPMARRDSTRSCARAASASGNTAAIAGLTPPASRSTAACMACRRGSGMWS